MRCPICQSEVKHLIGAVNGSNVFECSRCRLVALRRKMSATKPDKKLYSYKKYKMQEKRLDKRLRRLAQKIIKFIDKGKLLDVGAGFGQLSSILDDLGKFQIDLVEPLVEPKYLKVKKVVLHKISYERFLTRLLPTSRRDSARFSLPKRFQRFPERKLEGASTFHPTGGKFDLILMMDVVEHFDDPLTNLKETKKILKKGGYLVIQTPNYQSLMAMICRHWSWWMPQEHKFIFSTNSIKKILEKTGFKIIYMTTYEDFYDFKKNLDGNFDGIKNSFLKRLSKSVFFILFFPFHFLSRRVIWRLGYGGLIFIIAK